MQPTGIMGFISTYGANKMQIPRIVCDDCIPFDKILKTFNV